MNSHGRGTCLAPLRAAVLIGGQSRRMGEPKHLLQIAGRTFLERIVGALESNGIPVAVSGSGEIPSALKAIERVPDAPGVEGTLSGIVGALTHDRQSAWLIVPCDVPLLGAAAIEWLIAQREAGAVALMGRLRADELEPLPGVYEPGALTAVVQLAREGRALRDLRTMSRVSAAWIPVTLREGWRNINLREDLRDLGGGGTLSR
ncbi:MAG: molybdenum cofactor guanylyltransferase [Planctomycetia bacterium]|nr:MAG: molybdenum cofactor guanylyltransferase [Planctomycetia bacterium]